MLTADLDVSLPESPVSSPSPHGRRRIPEDFGASLWRVGTTLATVLALVFLCSCTSTRQPNLDSRRFDFQRDTFAYANGLVWEYGYDTNGVWQAHKREPEPDYTLHCFVVARSARQFFDNARFDPLQPIADDTTYRRLVRQVAASDPRNQLPESKRIVIPGYADLRSFSAAHEKVLQAQCGSAWQSYLQRGNWRMIFPVTRRHQAETGKELAARLKDRGPLLVHVFCFPTLSINHALLLFDAKETDTEIQFATYDPNDPSKPGLLSFDRARRTFILPSNAYFPGGPVDVYEIYCKWDY